MAVKQKVAGGFLTVIGFVLSPLSWWNDLVVNLPLALAFAWTVSLVHPPAFEASVVIGYWLTNIIGLILMHKGALKLIGSGEMKYSRRDLLKDFGVSLLYTVLILALIRAGILKPLEGYL